jgi:hypothetical protein
VRRFDYVFATVPQVVVRGKLLSTPRVANSGDDGSREPVTMLRSGATILVIYGSGNGTAGAQAMKAMGGLCIAQDPHAGSS